MEEESFKMEVVFEEMIHSYPLHGMVIKVKMLFTCSSV